MAVGSTLLNSSHSGVCMGREGGREGGEGGETVRKGKHITHL